MHIIKIDFNKCISCKTCVKACWEDVIRWDDSKNAPVAAYPEDCRVCCLCEVLCPVKAIEVIPNWQSKSWPRELMKVAIS